MLRNLFDINQYHILLIQCQLVFLFLFYILTIIVKILKRCYMNYSLRYRLGLDMGASSIGWAIYDLDKQILINCGVRIFDDGRDNKSKASLCVKRRNARGARRLTNRRHIKTIELLNTLTNIGLFPQSQNEREELKKQNPYKLRKDALDRQLSPYELGRAILQLAKRKGFLSNRKDDPKEGGKLLNGHNELLEKMQQENSRTYGEFLYNRQQKNRKNPIRLKNMFDEDGKFKGGLFPFRSTYMAEFDCIWKAQKDKYPDILTDENKKKLQDIIFFQRPLKEAEEGECLFEKGEKRIPKAHPLFQEFRIKQILLNLTYAFEYSSEYKNLEKEANDKLFKILMNPQAENTSDYGKIITYSKIKQLLGLKNVQFNYENSNKTCKDLEKGLLVNRTQSAINKSKYFISYWNTFSDNEKSEIIYFITKPHKYIDFPRKNISIEDERNIIIKHLCLHFALSQQAAEELWDKINIEDGYGSLSEKAIRKLLPLMETEKHYPEACKKAGYFTGTESYLNKLPYYGELLSQSCLGKKNNPVNDEEKFGKINNATVHVALNQVRYLVNELIDLYGKPYDISIEYARELKASQKERQAISYNQNNKEKENKQIIKTLKEHIKADREYNSNDILKYKIWKNLSAYSKKPLTKECPFSGTPIPLSDLLNGEKFQIEHLIPFSRSFDNSLSNKVIATVEANRYKGNRTPFEAFGQSKDGYNWKDILHRSKSLSTEQQWRFAQNAMEKFKENTGPIARSLNDTRYMTRLLQNYLLPIVREDGKECIQSVAGPLTAIIRKAWGLNLYKDKTDKNKYREFHNHHAIDAFVIAAIERSQIAEAVKRLALARDEVRAMIKDEFYNENKFVSEEDKPEIREKIKKRIKELLEERENAIAIQVFSRPKNSCILDVLKQVSNINISHKPSLKNINDKTSTIGQLHEDTAYGLQQFVDNKSLSAIFKCKKDGKNETTTKDIIQYIPIFRNKEDKKAYYDAFREWFVCNGKAESVESKSKDAKTIKDAITEKEQNTVQVLRKTSLKAFKWFVGGNNFCAEIYEINPNNKIEGLATKDRGEWKTEIISNYNATIRKTRNENIAYWHYKYPNAKRIMTLHRNDLVMATFTREQAFDEKFSKGLQEYVREKFIQNFEINELDILFRVKKLNGDGRIFLTPHNIAKEDADKKSWPALASSLKLYKARKINITFTGRISNA